MVFDNRKAVSVAMLAPPAAATLRATVTFTSLPSPAGALFAIPLPVAAWLLAMVTLTREKGASLHSPPPLPLVVLPTRVTLEADR